MEHRIRDKLLSSFNNLHRWLFYLLLLLIPTQLGYHFWPDFAFVNGIRVDYLAPTIHLTDLLVIGIGISWLSLKVTIYDLRITSKINIRNTKYEILIACFLFFILNVLFSSVPQLAILKLLTFIKLAFLAVYIVKTKPNFYISSGYLLVASGYSSIIGWIQFVNQSSIGGILWFLGERTFNITTPGIATLIMNNKLILRPYATFPHPNVLAGFITAMLPLVWYNTSTIIKKVKLPLLVFFLATLFITFSRSAWMVAGIVLIAVLLSNRHYLRIRNKNRATWILVTIISIILLPFLSERIVNLSSVDIQSITRRMDLNYAALKMAVEHPLFGVGLNNFLIALPNFLTINSYQDLQPAHNIYLLFIAEWGMIGFAIILFLLVNFWPAIKYRIRNTEYGTLSSSATLLLLGLFDHYPYTIHQIQLFTAILIGFILTGRTRFNYTHETH